MKRDDMYCQYQEFIDLNICQLYYAPHFLKQMTNRKEKEIKNDQWYKNSNNKDQGIDAFVN